MLIIVLFKIRSLQSRIENEEQMKQVLQEYERTISELIADNKTEKSAVEVGLSSILYVYWSINKCTNMNNHTSLGFISNFQGQVTISCLSLYRENILTQRRWCYYAELLSPIRAVVLLSLFRKS